MFSHSHLSSKTINRSKKKIIDKSGLSSGKNDGVIIVRVLEEGLGEGGFLDREGVTWVFTF